jgi:hypothetical protein
MAHRLREEILATSLRCGSTSVANAGQPQDTARTGLAMADSEEHPSGPDCDGVSIRDGGDSARDDAA